MTAAANGMRAKDALDGGVRSSQLPPCEGDAKALVSGLKPHNNGVNRTSSYDETGRWPNAPYATAHLAVSDAQQTSI
jgi:hypothetical protein